ncbi:hypothetical protein PILCRDRAFT_482821 [Piloderma croceum F 1598]|uniref:Uncharacterized protein n=1 Tax=Piloderma croceum (strain F 1598) TaxID=765440 RepID=A0A0C3FS75_PILCF|nr:hypothetical protein PILCRDRAFT_482821 [Piloderma croceum F 1598]
MGSFSRQIFGKTKYILRGARLALARRARDLHQKKFCSAIRDWLGSTLISISPAAIYNRENLGVGKCSSFDSFLAKGGCTVQSTLFPSRVSTTSYTLHLGALPSCFAT